MLSKEQIETKLLHDLNHGTIADSFMWAEEHNASHNDVVGVLKSLHGDEYVVTNEKKLESWLLTEEAKQIVEHGSPEFHFFYLVPSEGGMTLSDVPAEHKGSMGKAMKARWIKKQGDKLIRAVDDIVDELQSQLASIAKGNTLDDKTMKDLKKRKLIMQEKRTIYEVTKGSCFNIERKKPPADLTQTMLDDGDWNAVKFKPYNYNSFGVEPSGGAFHRLLKVRSEFRQILLEMGFEEMPTNRWVESSFWNFDALFQPQSHPARDMHDTFFVSDPATATDVPEDYLDRVKKMHEVGGDGSIGYRYDWKRSEADKNLLRTHTTAVSARMLYKLANQEGGFKPARYFSIDRVFRNETLDATHLAEFHQVEGLVADYNLSMRDLIGTIAEFFRRIGIEKLRFKPAYNPYTEPSMEIFGYHPDLKRWTEIGNSGIFRPEMLAPMNMPKNVRVIAWGLSLERPTMIKYRISNIRELCGAKVPLAVTRNSPIVRFQAGRKLPEGATVADLEGKNVDSTQ